MAESILREKSYTFSIQIVKLYQHLCTKKQEFSLGRQLLRSWTSIWALLREAEFWQSRADFINKMSISLKEANETLYRLDILKDTWYIDSNQYNSLYPSWKEILKMLISAIKTSKKTEGY
jgi:four helix bundle protein